MADPRFAQRSPSTGRLYLALSARGRSRRLGGVSDRMTSDTAQSAASGDDVLEVLDANVEWFSQKKANARRCYYTVEFLIILFAAAVPAATAFTSNGEVTAGLGFVVVVLTGLRQLARWQESWVRRAIAQQTLEDERLRYTQRTNEYRDGATRQGQLAKTLADVRSREILGWRNTFKTGGHDSAAGDASADGS
jgi:uncharacterized protein DUF4231